MTRSKKSNAEPENVDRVDSLSAEAAALATRRATAWAESPAGTRYEAVNGFDDVQYAESTNRKKRR